VLSGFVATAAPDSPVPKLELAEIQLRAMNHRFVNLDIDPDGRLLDGLTGEDFLLTDRDGTWHDRAGFLARARRRTPQPGASVEDMRVRLFGPVALVHAVFAASAGDGRFARVRYTDVHVWADTTWRLVSVQDTSLQDAVAVPQQSGIASAHAMWPGQDPIGNDLAVLHALNQNYVKAFREADAAWYDAHLAPDFVVISGNGSFHDRAAALANFARPAIAAQFRSFPVDRVNLRRFDDVALLHAENAYELKDNRKGVSRYTDIWHKRDGRWLCIAAHITVHEAPT
jgi:uncharacterized protein (TIGR02246 family)